MATRRPLSEDSLQELKAAMKAARTPDELRGLQCIWLPAALGLSGRQVALALDCPLRAVRRGRERYQVGGPGGLQDRRRPPLAPGEAEALGAALKRARRADDLRRIQCVWLRARLGLERKQVAAVVGWKPVTVSAVQSRYRRQGLAALQPARSAPTLPEDEAQKLRDAMKAARTVPQYRRALCLFMRVVLGFSSAVAARIAGVRARSVAHLYQQYLREGEAALWGEGRGGARRHVIALEKESEVLRNLARQSSGGGLLTFAFIHNAFETAAGRPLKASTVQAILDRHRWSRDALVITPLQTRRVETPEESGQESGAESGAESGEQSGEESWPGSPEPPDA